MWQILSVVFVKSVCLCAFAKELQVDVFGQCSVVPRQKTARATEQRLGCVSWVLQRQERGTLQVSHQTYCDRRLPPTIRDVFPTIIDNIDYRMQLSVAVDESASLQWSSGWRSGHDRPHGPIARAS